MLNIFLRDFPSALFIVISFCTGWLKALRFKDRISDENKIEDFWNTNLPWLKNSDSKLNMFPIYFSFSFGFQVVLPRWWFCTNNWLLLPWQAYFVEILNVNQIYLGIILNIQSLFTKQVFSYIILKHQITRYLNFVAFQWMGLWIWQIYSKFVFWSG
jgi:hypothetical protein